MPIDPSIPLGVKVAQFQSPIEAMTQVAQLQALREQTAARAAEAAEKQAETAEKQRARAAAAQTDALLKEAVGVDPTSGALTVDYPKLIGHLPAETFFKVREHLQTDATLAKNLQTANLTHAEKQREFLAKIGQTVRASGDDPQVFQTEITVARNLGLLTPAQADQALALTDPAAIKRVVDGAIAHGGVKPPSLEKVTTVDDQGREVTKFVAPTAGAAYPVAPKAPAAPAYQAKDVLLDGRPALVSFNPQTGTYHLNDQDVTARVRPIPPQGPGPEPIVSVMGPDGKPIYVTRSQALGQTPGGAAGEAGGVKLSAGQQEDIATMLTVQDLGNEAVTLGDRIKWRGVGPVAGRMGEAGARYFGAGGEEPERLRNLIGNIQGTIAKLRGGASFTPSEQAMLDRYTPTTTDSVLQIKAKLKSLSDYITTKRENTIRVASGQYTPRDETAAPREGEQRPIPNVSGGVAEYRGGKWIRVK